MHDFSDGFILIGALVFTFFLGGLSFRSGIESRRGNYGTPVKFGQRCGCGREMPK